MKYVDEFRDRDKAQILVARSRALVGAIKIPERRPIQIMEVCGGHTHSIFRYGIEGHAAESDRAGAWTRLSGVRAADGPRRRLRRDRRTRRR